MAKLNDSKSIIFYDSPLEFYDVIKNGERVSGRGNSSEKMGSKWSGEPSVEVAYQKMIGGDDDSYALLKKLKERTDEVFKSTTAQIKNRKIENDVVGFQPVVPNAILGLPKSMINQRTEVKKQKIVTVFYNASQACKYDAEDLATRGAWTLSMLETLEKRGFRVRLYMGTISISDNSGLPHGHTVMLKSPSKRMNTKKLAFYLVNPAYLRRITFKLLECEERIPWIGFGYGQNLGFDKQRKAIHEKFGENVIVVDSKSLPIDASTKDDKAVELLRELFKNVK